MVLEAPVFPRPAVSLIVDDLPPYGARLYIGDTEGARDLALLRDLGISTVINCAVNLDINYVTEPSLPATDTQCAAGTGAIRCYKLGLVDGPGNPETMMLSGYYLLHGAVHQEIPDKHSYPRRERGNILVHCRGGRSRSVALVALYLHKQLPLRFPTLDEALAHIRQHRELHPDEWFETPKPMLLDAVKRASDWIGRIDSAQGAG